MSFCPNFWTKGQVLAERKVLSELLKFSKKIEELNKPNEIYYLITDFDHHETNELIRVEGQKVNGYTYKVSEEKSLENIEKQLRYNEVEILFNKIRDKGKLFIGQLNNLKYVRLFINE